MAWVCPCYKPDSKIVWSFYTVATFMICAFLFYINYASRNQRCLAQHNFDCVINKEKVNQGNCPHFCTTKECLYAANYMIKKIDMNVNPCEDFHNFSCGQWMDAYKGLSARLFETMDNILELKVREVLENLKDDPQSAAGKMKILYDTCIKKETSELRARSSALKFLQEIGIPNWPHLNEDFTFMHVALEEAIGYLISHEHQYFFGVEADKRFFKKSKEADAFSIPTLPLAPINITITRIAPLTTKKNIAEYIPLIRDLLDDFDLNELSINRSVDTFNKIERALQVIDKKAKHIDAKRVMSKSQKNDNDYYLDCLNNDNEFLEPVCKIIEKIITFLKVQNRYSTERIYIGNKHYIEHVLILLSNTTESDLAMYIGLRFFLEHLSDLDLHFMHLWRNYKTLLYKDDSVNYYTRWKHCVHYIMKRMSPALALKYLPTHLPEESHREIREIFHEVKGEMLEAMQNVDWLKPEMQEDLVATLNATQNGIMRVFDLLSNESVINQVFEEFHPNHESFLFNVIEIERHSFLYSISNYTEDVYLLTYDYFQVNALYENFNNRMTLLFGILLPPIYVSGRPKLMNLATLGPMIGHELGHAVDLFFGYDDRMTPKYEEKKKCLINLYSEFNIEMLGQKYNGTKTFRDDMSDYLGLVYAEKVYGKLVKNFPVFSLPLANFTTEQTFYIAYAQMYCSVYNKEILEWTLKTDQHSPNFLRVNGVLKNIEEFGKAFKCLPGSPMNIEKKCSFS